jgi:hypothetical protein
LTDQEKLVVICSHGQGRIPHPKPQSPLSRLDTLNQATADELQSVVHLRERLYLVREGERKTQA